MPDNVDGLPKLGAERGALAKIGSLGELREALGEIIAKLQGEIAEQVVLIDVLPLKAAHTLATLAGVFVRLHETADLEARLTEVERRLAEERGQGAR